MLPLPSSSTMRSPPNLHLPARAHCPKARPSGDPVQAYLIKRVTAGRDEAAAACVPEIGLGRSQVIQSAAASTPTPLTDTRFRSSPSSSWSARSDSSECAELTAFWDE